MMTPTERLEVFYASALKRIAKPFVANKERREKIEFLCRCNANKAPIRFTLSCLLATIDRPTLDIRKPYTEIEGDDSYSGRYYDEAFVQPLVHKYKLPCNPTTAYLTPAFRNIDRILTPQLVLVGRPREVYQYTLQIIDAVHSQQETAENILQEFLRFLLIIKQENESRMQQLLAELKQTKDILPLSSEEIVTLLIQHLSSNHASRLPVLIVAAAYIAVGDRIGEDSMPLEAHNAADKQTGSLGDIEVTLVNDEKVITSYEMKDKRITKDDIDVALQKLKGARYQIDNYIFITTDTIERDVLDYAKSCYELMGTEFAILDCIGFIRHYLHFFHRTRIAFLNIYQELVLHEPTSSVSQPLKEVFLALRRAAETDR
jgi:SacI restriction endonuclease